MSPRLVLALAIEVADWDGNATSADQSTFQSSVTLSHSLIVPHSVIMYTEVAGGHLVVRREAMRKGDFDNGGERAWLHPEQRCEPIAVDADQNLSQ